MANPYINRAFYEAVLDFESSEDAQDYYYKIMDTETGKVRKNGYAETVRDQILRIYAMLFCDEMDMLPGQPAGPDEVEATADRLYTGQMGLDPRHWYRMRHHFPVIDDDNYDRFAALVISDLCAGPLHEAAINEGDMLLVGEADPLKMTSGQRKKQKLDVITFGQEDAEL